MGATKVGERNIQIYTYIVVFPAKKYILIRAVLTDERRSIPLLEYFALKELLSRALGLHAGVGTRLWQPQSSIPVLQLLERLSTLLHGGA